ncbi:MAG: GNAT family N-acetyltransferase [Blastocatellia bacterium]
MIKEALTDADILSTFDVMKQLRTHLVRDDYVETINRLRQTNNYHLVALVDDGAVRCVAGYRLAEGLSWRKYLYVDDLITDENARSNNYGKQMMDWLVGEAKRNNCDQLHLDSGTQRYDAHRFYLRERMIIDCFHFSLKLRS